MYLSVLSLTALGLGLSLLLEPWLEPDFSVLFLGAVALAARKWGMRAGIASELFAIPSLLMLYLPPHYTFHIASIHVAARLGSFVATAALIVWVTERSRRVERELSNTLEEVRTREERFRVALLKSPVVVFHQNTDLRYIWVYNPFPEHTGVTLLNKLDSDLFPADEAAELTRIKRGVLATGEGVREEVVLSSRGGKVTMDVTFEPFLDSDGKIAGVLGTAVDITEQKRHERNLRDSQDRFRSLAWHLRSTLEDQRTMTSREIHDNVSQMLAALDLELATISRMVSDGDGRSEIGGRLRAIEAVLSSTIETSERISSRLRPSLLDNLGLASAIESQVREFQGRTGIAAFTSSLAAAELSSEVSTGAFRIVQQILAGIESRADATCVSISLRQGFAGLVLQIHDNGRSAAIENEEGGSGSLRLLDIQERASSFGGRATIHTVRGQGTTVWVEIPALSAVRTRSRA